MEPTAVTAGTTGTTGTTPSSGTTQGERAAKQSFATLFAAAEKKLHDGEKLERVKNHAYARIQGGARDEKLVNLSGNARNGQVFDLVSRGGHTFHVYGSGKDHVVVEVGRKHATGTTSGGTQAAS
jgi:hypothetical protein